MDWECTENGMLLSKSGFESLIRQIAESHSRQTSQALN